MSSQYFRFVARDSSHRRVPLLEQLIARADDGAPVVDWRADAFRVIAPRAASMPAVAAAALCADRAAVDTATVDTATVDTAAVSGSWVCAATPVHYTAEMTSVRLASDGMLSLTTAAAETLASDFNRIWKGSGIRMFASRSAQLFCIFDSPLEVVTRDPEDVLDRHIEEFLPAGEDAARLRQLISETEMWLFEHEANRARAELDLPAINGLWFWGGGARIAALPAVEGWAAGNDLFFNAFSVSRDEKFQSGVIAASCVPGSDQWQAVESRWLRPAIDQLRTRRLSRLQISAADRCFTVTAAGLRRFWRRRKPWWESFE
ncbi:MAG: hypothetical protein ABI356_15810 [Steroidobacteraceae bacterium]